MNRRSSLLDLLVLTCFCTLLVSSPAVAETATDPVAVSADDFESRCAPHLTLPADTALVWCQADSICYEVSASDVDLSDSLTLSLLQGPIEVPVQQFGYQFTTTVCFRPEVSGPYLFVWQLVDRQQHVVVDSVTFTVQIEGAPAITNQQFFSEQCDLREDRVLPLSATGTNLHWQLLSGPGTLDPSTGVLTYRPDTSGVFSFTVAVSNDCGADTAAITDQLVLNLPPYCLPFDTTIYLCDQAEICFGIFATDPENDPIQITQLEGLGTFTQTSDTSGVTCFLPADIQSATYRFIYYSSDSCVRSHANEAIVNPLCCIDTVRITVIITPEGELACPGDTTIDLCVPPDQLPEQICLTGFSSTWSSTQVSLGTLKGDTLCFTPDRLGVYAITMLGSDTCGHADTCTTLVTLKGNQAPVLEAAADFALQFCLPDSVCFDVSAYDPDGTAVQVSVSENARFDPETGRVCFFATEPGSYEIVTTATDNCGMTVSDTTIVTLTPSTPPSVSLGRDTTVFQCTAEEICIPAGIVGDQITDITPSLGQYNPETGEICVAFESAGLYVLTLDVTDACGGHAADTVLITVHRGTAPEVTAKEDTTLVLCAPEAVCIPVSITDADDDIVSITSSLGAYADGEVCFTPEASGVYVIEVVAVDACQFIDQAIITVTVEVGSAPVIADFRDTTIYLCRPQQICLTANISDPDGDIMSITTSRGAYANGQICFVPYSMQVYDFVLTVTDSCGHVTTDTAYVDVKTDQDIHLVCPGDTTVFLCEPDTLCFPIEGIPEGAQVSVGGIGATWNAETQSVCFYSDCCLDNTLSVSITTPCGTHSCEFTVYVQTNSQPLVLMPSDTTVTLCQPGAPLCIPVGISDIDDNIAQVQVEGGTYDDYRNIICLDLQSEGTQTVTVTVTDSCGAVRTDEMNVTVRSNQAPIVYSILEDSVFRMCELDTIYIPLRYGDPDRNLASLTSPNGPVMRSPRPDSSTAILTYVPNGFGLQCVTVTATDSCGLSASTEICITILQPEPVAIDCPGTPGAILCGAGTACFDIPISGQPSEVITSLGRWSNGQLCVDVESSIEEMVTVIAVGECASDTCRFMLSIDVVQTPEIACPGDTSVFLCHADTLEFPITLAGGGGPDWHVTALAPAWVFQTGATSAIVYVPVLEPGSQTVTVIHSSAPCPSAECSFTVTGAFNSAPTVSMEDVASNSCELEEICVPFYVDDVDGNIDSMVSSLGVVTLTPTVQQPASGPANSRIVDKSFDLLETPPTGTICFTPGSFGEFPLTLTVIDECGARVEKTVIVVVNEKPHVAIQCPTEPEFTFCESGSHCLPLPIIGGPFEVTSSLGVWSNNELCLDAAAPGTYNVTVIATAECNSDTCTVSVRILEPVTVTCGVQDTSVFLCEGAETNVQVPVLVTGDNPVVTVNPSSATYADGYVTVPVDDNATIAVTVSVTNECSETSCEFTVRSVVNRPPVVDAGADTSFTLCELEEVCVPFWLSDLDSNVVEIRSSLGVVTLIAGGSQRNDGRISSRSFDKEGGDIPPTGRVCFTPSAYGDYAIVLTAIDECGVIGEDTINISVTPGVSVMIDCPTELITLAVRVPDTIRIPVAIQPTAGVDISVAPFGSYDAATGELVAYVEATGTYKFTITAIAECNTAICDVSVEIGQYVPPFVQCLSTVDTALCLVNPDTLCVPVTVYGSNIQVTVTPPAYYSDGQVCLPVAAPGQYVIDIKAFNEEDADSCTSTIMVTGGNPPLLRMPDDYATSLCEPSSVCVDVLIQDTDFDIVQIDVSQGSYDAESGTVCFTADASGVYTVGVTVVDKCGNTVSDTTVVTVDIAEPPMVGLPEDETIFLCDLSEICIDAQISGSGELNITNSLGTYNPETHKICFVPDGPGTYVIAVTVLDACGLTAADTVVYEVELNTPPVISNFNDSTVYLCRPGQVCLPIDISDADGNLASVVTSRGTYQNGAICWVPYSQGAYDFIVTATDSCGRVDVDTARLVVKTDEDIVIDCPNDTTVFLCEPDTLCFPVGGVPAGAQVTVNGIATWWNAETQSVCFFSDCCLDNTLTVTVTTACGSRSCEFTVYVQTNTPPLVMLPTDTTIVQCEFSKICLPVGVSDIDDNVASVATSFGTYDSYRHVVCFTPTAAGAYPIRITAVDSCGASRYDDVVVTVKANEAPVVTLGGYPTDELCELPSQVCVPLTVTDGDNNIVSITTSRGQIVDGEVCFTPEAFGSYQIIVTALDECGVSAVDTSVVTLVHNESWADIVMSGELDQRWLCEPGQVCVNVPYIQGQDYRLEVVGDGVTLVGDQMCFTADTSGSYEWWLKAISDCNRDSVEISVDVHILEPYEFVSCPADTQVSLCGPDTLTFPYQVTGGGHWDDKVQVLPPAYLQDGLVHVPVLASGLQTVTLIANSANCKDDTCSFTVTSTFNSAPTVTLGPDINRVECAIPNVRIPLHVTDPDGNVTSIQTTHGTVSGDSVVNFQAASWGSYRVIVTATDACGLSDADTVMVTLTEGAHANIQCPDGTQFAAVCGPDTICIVAPITPSNAQVRVFPSGYYNPQAGTVCVFVTSGGTRQITVIADAQCGSDTCSFNLAVDFGIPPDVTAPTAIDTLMCLARPDTLCFNVGVVGTGAQVTVKPAGYYSAGVVCIPVSAPGYAKYTIVATGTCGIDSAIVGVTIRADQAPQLILPTGLVFERCPDDTNHICIDGIRGIDAESDVLLSMTCGQGTFTTMSGDSGEVCFKPTEFGQSLFCFQATDGCHTVIDTMIVDIVMKDDCDVCLRMKIDGGSCSPVGLRHEVELNIETNDRIGGFDVLIKYDASALSFQNARMTGGDAQDWEYFTWNTAVGVGLSGYVRFVGIADRNNGAAHPPDSAYRPNGVLVYLEFLIANNQNLGGQFVPVSFTWLDCTDNSFADPTGAILYVDSRIFNAEDQLIWDEFDNVTYPDASRPLGMGIPDSCINMGGKTQPVRCAEFYNGGVCIIHPDEIDARGDVNLNGLAYEISDAVVFTNYFIRGLVAFTINVQGQIAASDCNADGLTLTVADLTTLIRVIVGDCDPIPKVTPYADDAFVYTDRTENALAISTETSDNVGAMYLVYDIPAGLTVGEPSVSADAAGFSCKHSVENGQLRLLLYDIGTSMVASGRHELVELPLSGEGELTLTHVELVDYQGRSYRATAKAALPTEFELMQNYPNPFNPTTTISFLMPVAGDWSVSIYNIQGALVNEYHGASSGGRIEVVWDGHNSGGTATASGVYFYRLDAAGFSDTKKMILLK